MTGSARSAVTDFQVFPPPSEIVAAVRMPAAAAARVARSRDEVCAVLNGADDRLLVITGPCSVHDPRAALEYAARLAAMAWPTPANRYAGLPREAAQRDWLTACSMTRAWTAATTCAAGSGRRGSCWSAWPR